MEEITGNALGSYSLSLGSFLFLLLFFLLQPPWKVSVFAPWLLPCLGIIRMGYLNPEATMVPHSLWSLHVCAYVLMYVFMYVWEGMHVQQGFSLAVEFVDLPTPSSQQALESFYLDPWHWVYRYMPLHLAFCICSGIRSSCLCGKYFLATSSWSCMIGPKLAIGLKLLLYPRKL